MRIQRWDARSVRAYIAHEVLGEEMAPLTMGEIRLLPHQLDAVRRIRPALQEFRGALLADAVGLGKTYVALSFAAEAQRPLIVAPAALRITWTQALARSEVNAGFASMESLSRGWRAPEQPDFVIVDEAHHFRSAGTRRYASLAALSATARVLLLSATPVHNSRRDLEALLALFLGARVGSLTHEDLSRLIVRRSEAEAALALPLPDLRAMRWLPLPNEDDLLEQIVGLPPPVPPSDGGDAGVLAIWSLVRQWASSRAALVRALRKRVARAVAMEALMEAGRTPSVRALAAWRFAEDSVQLALPGLIGREQVTGTGCSALLDAIITHRVALESLLDQLSGRSDPDDARAALIREIRLTHHASRIIAFSEYEATVAALFRRLASGGAVAMLSSRGARVSGGELRRDEVLRRFAPSATGATPATRSDDVTLLLATELLAEGVNLQDADVVLHLDLPWNPARLEQRVGRVRRIGASRPVHTYALAPPAGAERLLEVERRLREKMHAAGSAIGLHGSVLPVLLGAAGGGDGTGSAAEHATQVARSLQRWRRPCAVRAPAGDAVILACAVRAACTGYLALVRVRERAILLASLEGRTSTDPEVVAHAISLAGGAPTAGQPDFARALQSIRSWLHQQRLEELLGAGSAPLVRTRQRLLRRIAAVERQLPRHLRREAASLVAQARAAALAPAGAHVERALAALSAAPGDGVEWLQAVTTPGADSHSHAHRNRTEASDRHIQALILFTGDTGHPSRLSSFSDAELTQ